MKQPPRRRIGIVSSHAGRIVLAYIVVGALWILFSDLVVSSLARNEEILSRIQSYKGLAFIGMTATLLFLLIRQAERSLGRENLARRKSEATARALLNGPADTIFLLDAAGMILDVNETAVRTFAQSREELIGCCIWDLVTVDVGTRRKPYVDKVIQTGEPVRFEEEREGIWFDNVLYPILDEQQESTKVAVIARDITERKQAQRALQESKERYQRLVEGIQDEYFIYSHNPDGVFAYLSPSITNVLGYAPEEYFTHYTETFTENPINKAADLRTKASIRGEKQPSFEVEVHHKDGGVRNLEILEQPVFDDQKQVIAVEGIAHNITERKQVEDALRDSETKLHAIFDHHYQLTGLLDCQGRLLAANRTALDFAGVDESEVIGHYFWESPWWEHSQEVELRDAVERAARGQFVRFETTHPTKEGGVRYMDFSLSPVKDDDGNVTYIVPEGRDVTEMKQATEALRKERDYNKLILEEMPAFFVSIDRDGACKMVNKTMLNSLGYKKEEVVGEDYLTTFVPPEEHDKVRNVFKNLVHGGNTESENHVISKDGNRILVLWNGRPILDADGQISRFIGFGLDITERKQAEHALRSSEEKFSKAFHSSPDSISITLIDNGRIVDINEGFEEMFGYSRDESLGKTTVELNLWQSSEDRDVMLKEFEDKGRIKELEIRMRDKTGDIHTCQLSCEAINIDEKPCFVTIARDITERKRAEERIQESQAKLRDEKALSDAIIMSLPGLFYMFDEHGYCVRWNEREREFAGLTDEEMPRKHHLAEIPSEEDRAALTQGFQDILTHGYAELEHKSFHRTRGELRTYLSTGTRIMFEGVPYVLGMALDITERKQAEEEAMRLRNYLKNIVDSMPSMLIGLDVEGRVTEWNNRTEETTGVRKDQALGRMLPEVMPCLTPQMDRIAQATASHQVQKEEKVAQRIGGQTQYSDITIYPLIANGVAGAVMRIDDVTDRVRLEEMMVQAEKMATVGGLAAGMAHEINNPLGVIIQGVQTIERRLSADLPANHEAAHKHQVALESIRAYLNDREVLDMVDMVKEAGSRAASIIKNMLQFSRRSDTGKTRVGLDQLIDRTIDLATNDYDLKKRYDFRDIHLEYKYDPSLTEIVCVRTEIEQVLLNLLKNAAQAISEVKDLTEPHIEVRTRRKGDRALIEVEDNGPGMSEDVRRRVFEPFFTTKEVGIGTGLGLSVSYMIITDKHQGTLTVDSSPGRGTRFTVELPIEQNVE